MGSWRSPARRGRRSRRAGSIAGVVAAGLTLVTACSTTEPGDLDGSLRLPIAFGLQRDQEGLAETVAMVSDPLSDTYREWLTPEEISERHGLPEQDSARVLSTLEAAGFVGSVHSSGGLIHGTMSVTDAERFLGVRMTSAESGGLSVVYPTSAPTIPNSLRDMVTEVVGLSAAVGTDAPPWPDGGLDDVPCPAIPSVVEMLREQYALPVDRSSAARGAGVRLAILAVSAISEEAVDGLERCLDLDLPPVRTVAVDASPSSVFGDVAIETTLDIASASMIAPDLEEIVMYRYNPVLEFVFPFAAITDDIGPDGPHIISSSLGKCETTRSQTSLDLSEWLLMTAAASGVTVVTSSGDDGSSSCANDRSVPAVQYPASSPFITAVGGTQFLTATQLTDAINDPIRFVDRDDQVVWNSAPLRMQAAGAGSSARFDTPWYQHSVVTGSMRSIPDVAFLASPQAYGELPVCNSSGRCEFRYLGGTSASSPGFAAALAVMAGALPEPDGSPGRFGLLNPALYELGRRSSAAYDDIVEGDNDLYGVGCCTAGVGFDAASGWGSLNVDELADFIGGRHSRDISP